MSVVRTTISIPEGMFMEIKKEAKKHGMSISRFIVSSLQDFLIVQRKQKAAREVLEIAEKNPLSGAAIEIALKEVKELKKGWK